MVDGTPVLDIKPYIPQYDYPGIAHLNIRENHDSSSTFVCNIDNHETDVRNVHMENINERVMDGEENGHIPNIMPHENSR